MASTSAKPAAPIRSIGLMIFGVCLFPIPDAIAKHIINDFHLVQLVWGRMFFQTMVVLLVIAATRRWSHLRTGRFRLQALGGTSGWLAHFPFFLALAYLPLADTVSVALVAPLMVTALSVPLLAERVGIHRWTAVVVGFLGAMVIIRPGLGVVHWAAFLPLLAAACFSLYQIAVRRLGTTDRTITILFYASAVPAALNSLIVPFFWTQLDLTAWLLLAAIGCLSGISHFAVIKALEAAPASLLAPILYVQLISATILGYLLFGDFPDRWTILGAIVIAGAGIYVAYRERRLRR